MTELQDAYKKGMRVLKKFEEKWEKYRLEEERIRTIFEGPEDVQGTD